MMNSRKLRFIKVNVLVLALFLLAPTVQDNSAFCQDGFFSRIKKSFKASKGMSAVEKGDIAGIEAWVDAGGDLNRMYSNLTCDYMRVTPLYLAVHQNQNESIRYLLDHGADPTIPVTIKKVKGLVADTPIALAIDNDNIPALDLLLSKLKDLKSNFHRIVTDEETFENNKSSFNILCVSIQHGNESVLDHLFESPLFEPELTSFSGTVKTTYDGVVGFGALTCAVMSRNDSILKKLLQEKHLDPNASELEAAGKEHIPPLEAALNGHPLETIKILIEAGARPNPRLVKGGVYKNIRQEVAELFKQYEITF